jgi:hypothetical protein
VPERGFANEKESKNCCLFISFCLPCCSAYRYIFLDAGHVAQNLYLSAESINCGVCVVGAFSDDELNSILNLDGKEQFAIYMASVGKKIR